jgi:hypothetical protein
MTSIQGIVSTLRELFMFMWKRRLWWLVPMVVVLLLFAVLIVLGSVSGVTPFIYTLF